MATCVRNLRGAVRAPIDQSRFANCGAGQVSGAVKRGARHDAACVRVGPNANMVGGRSARRFPLGAVGLFIFLVLILLFIIPSRETKIVVHESASVDATSAAAATRVALSISGYSRGASVLARFVHGLDAYLLQSQNPIDASRHSYGCRPTRMRRS